MTGWSNGGWDDGYIPDGAELAMAAEGQWPYTTRTADEDAVWAAYADDWFYFEYHDDDNGGAPKPNHPEGECKFCEEARA